MIQVRQGVFETNSSSTHAICIARERSKPLDRVEFKIGDFGWSHHVYHDTETKASYLYTAACDFYGTDMADRISEILSPYGIECVFTKRPMYVSYNSTHCYLANGGIDHAEECGEFLDKTLNDPAILIDFLFGDKSYIETGNDNDDYSYPRFESPKCEHIIIRK